MAKGKKINWSKRIEALLEKVGSLQALGVKLGVSWFSVRGWQRGEHEPSPMAQRQIEILEKDQEEVKHE